MSMESIKRLFPYLKPYRRTIVITLLLGVLLSAVSLGTAKLVQITIDDIFVKKNRDTLYYMPLVIIGIYLVFGVIRFLHMYFLRYTGDRVAVDIRNDLQSKYAHLS